MLNPEHIRSSIARRLGMDIVGLVPADWNVEGVVEAMDANVHNQLLKFYIKAKFNGRSF